MPPGPLFKKCIRWIIVAAVIVAVVVAWTWYSKARHKKACALRKKHIKDACNTVDPRDTIFVSIASYRDPECPRTVLDCFEKARCPLRIFIGVCQQNHSNDLDTLAQYEILAKKKGTSGIFHDNLRVLRMDCNEAKGPMYARALIEKELYRGEKYYLIIDSHTCFSKDWDVHAIAQLESCRAYSNKPVLTMYPDDFSTRSKSTFTSETELPGYLRFKKINQISQLPEIEGPSMIRNPPRCFPSLFWAACFSFSYAKEMMHEVPYDPYCPYVFQGEEISMAARLFTHGWDLFSPKTMLVKHMWARKRPTFWEQFSDNSAEHSRRRRLEREGYHRLRLLMRMEPYRQGDQPLGKYDLGNARSLFQYEDYCGIHFLSQTVLPHARLGVQRHNDPDEILCKFNSIGEFEIERSRK